MRKMLPYILSGFMLMPDAASGAALLNGQEIRNVLVGHTMTWQDFLIWHGEKLKVYLDRDGHLLFTTSKGLLRTLYKVGDDGSLCLGLDTRQPMCLDILADEDGRFSVRGQDTGTGDQTLAYISDVEYGDTQDLTLQYETVLAELDRQRRNEQAKTGLTVAAVVVGAYVLYKLSRTAPPSTSSAPGDNGKGGYGNGGGFDPPAPPKPVPWPRDTGETQW